MPCHAGVHVLPSCACMSLCSSLPAADDKYFPLAYLFPLRQKISTFLSSGSHCFGNDFPWSPCSLQNRPPCATTTSGGSLDFYAPRRGTTTQRGNKTTAQLRAGRSKCFATIKSWLLVSKLACLDLNGKHI